MRRLKCASSCRTADKVWSATRFDFYLTIGKTIRFCDGNLTRWSGIQLEYDLEGKYVLEFEYDPDGATVFADLSHVEGKQPSSLVDVDPILWQNCKGDTACMALCLSNDVSNATHVPRPASRALQ